MKENPFTQFLESEWFKNMDKEYWPILAHEYDRNGPLEVVQWDLFDRVTLPATTSDQGRRRISFFQQSMGTAPYGEIDSSMMLPGAIPGNRTFVVGSLGLVVPRRLRSVWDVLAPWASCELRISAKVYRHIPMAMIPVFGAGEPIYRKVTREMRVPGKGWSQVVVEESKSPLLTFTPHPVILPHRPFELVMSYAADRGQLIRPLPLMAVLTGWDIRQAF
jgi:hypothetical protein